MDKPSTKPSPASGCLSVIGLATLITCGALMTIALTVSVPPWLKVETQRREVLYFSEHVKDYEQTFVGYDSLFASSKWQSTGPTAPRAPGQYFDVTEYRIWWPLLTGEWFVIACVASVLFVVLRARLHRPGTTSPAA